MSIVIYLNNIFTRLLIKAKILKNNTFHYAPELIEHLRSVALGVALAA